MVKAKNEAEDEKLALAQSVQQEEQAVARQEGLTAIQEEYENDRQVLQQYMPGIVCWGDSVTAGSSGNVSYPYILQKIGSDVDVSIATTQMMLEAALLGLGTTWIGAFNHQKARELFEIPEYLVPVVLLPIGHPAEDVKPSPAHFNRFAMEHSVI